MRLVLFAVIRRGRRRGCWWRCSWRWRWRIHAHFNFLNIRTPGVLPDKNLRVRHQPRAQRVRAVLFQRELRHGRVRRV